VMGPEAMQLVAKMYFLPWPVTVLVLLGMAVGLLLTLRRKHP